MTAAKAKGAAKAKVAAKAQAKKCASQKKAKGAAKAMPKGKAMKSPKKQPAVAKAAAKRKAKSCEEKQKTATLKQSLFAFFASPTSGVFFLFLAFGKLRMMATYQQPEVVSTAVSIGKSIRRLVIARLQELLAVLSVIAWNFERMASRETS